MQADTRPVIAVINPSSVLGGAEISLLEVLERCRDCFKFHLIVPEDGPLVSRATAAGIRVSQLPWPKRLERAGERNKRSIAVNALKAASALPGVVRRLRALLKEIDPAVVITNGIKAHILGTLATDRKRARIIWYARDGMEGRQLTRMVLRSLSSRCDGVIAISNYVAAEMVTTTKRRRLPVHVVYNIVDSTKFRPGLSAPHDLVKRSNEVWIGIVGAVTELKGHDIFLAAAASALRSVPSLRFLVLGSNLYKTEGHAFEESLKERAGSPELQGRVSFLGFRDDVPELLSFLDILVQCNRGPEGLGRSVLEAMACGTSVIAVDKWGPAELIEHGRTGLKTRPLDVDDLAQRMITLATNSDLRRMLGQNGRAWIEKNLDPDALTARVSSIIEQAALNRPLSSYCE